MLVIGPMVLELCPPPQLAKKITSIRIKKVTTADRQYCIDPPHPSGVVIRNAPEWLKTNSVAVFEESFLGPGDCISPLGHGGTEKDKELNFDQFEAGDKSRFE